MSDAELPVLAQSGLFGRSRGYKKQLSELLQDVGSWTLLPVALVGLPAVGGNAGLVFTEQIEGGHNEAKGDEL